MARACSGFTEERGEAGASTAPCTRTREPSAATASIRARSVDSTNPERTTSTNSDSADTSISFPPESGATGKHDMMGGMRAVVQRVSAGVGDGGRRDGRGDRRPGLCVLVGVTHEDTPEKAAQLARKLWSVRILRGARSPAPTSTRRCW